MEHKSIAKALASAQAEMGKALKASVNPHFRSKYADLANVMDACLPALNKAGIAVIQPMTETELGRYVNTIFIHESGEKLECPVPLIVSKQDMQGLGSAITYARRYGLMSLAGIAPEDDDGNAAAAGAQPAKAEGWMETILAELPPTATAREKAEAVTQALIAQFRRKKSETQLSNEWDRRARERKLLEKYEDLHDSVIDAYENHMMDLAPKEAAE